MITRIARLMMVAVVIFIVAIYLPKFYWKIFDKKIRTPQVYYSAVHEEFFLGKHNGKKYVHYDLKGNQYTREEFEQKLPLLHYRQLVLDNDMPEYIQGRKIELDELRLNKFIKRVRPHNLDQPQIDLYPLIESQSGRVQLAMPEEMFRITDRMEFITAATNQIDEKLTELFTTKLIAQGFKFPAQYIAGNPTTRKPFDEGYFVVDAANEVFQIKMIQGQPFCRKTGIPTNLEIQAILIGEMNLREFYGMLITKTSDVYLITYDNYKLVKLPLNAYQLDKTNLRWMGDIFYRTFWQMNEGEIHVIVTDRDYEIVDEYRETWETREDWISGKLAKVLFPFTITLLDGSSVYLNTYFEISSMFALVGILIALGLYVALALYLKKPLSPIDLVIVAITGLYGLIAVYIFRAVEID
ncbi:MAG: DUF4857 domain-containing protein [Candidatus Marinimicrobia bacterium]|nr:DUF4857 domain-containing protein [Candidatus Neomarinimicrobiota bacterium]